MATQTPVQWLVEQVNADCLNSTFIKPELVEKAMEKEKERMEYFYDRGQIDYVDRTDDFERIYNRKFKSKQDE
jgi:hypothetical protein